MIAAFRAWLGPSRRDMWPTQVRLPSGDVPLVIRPNNRARRLSLRVCPASRTVRLTVPPRATMHQARAFLDANLGWIEAQVAHRLPVAIPFQPGTQFPVAGRLLRLMPGTGRTVRRIGDDLLVPGDSHLFAARTRRWLAAEACTLLAAETQALAATIGKSGVQVRVADPKSRWGSCSADGRIAYSWRLILAPDFVRRSVVAHEVAHLVHMNHSAGFWQLASSLLGEPHDKSRAWLRRNGPVLLCYGAVEPG